VNRSLLILAALAASCSSTPWDDDRVEPVDAAYLMEISEDDRQDIAKLRASEAELEDELAFAVRDIEAKQADKKVAEQELDVAQQEVEEAEARIEAARTSGEIEAARERLRDTRMHVAWAKAQIAYHDGRIDWSEAKRDLAERRIELGAARVEQRKAQAVDELPEEAKVPDFELAVYDANIAQAELAVRLADIDVDAAAAKARAHREAMDKLADNVPEERRSSWRHSVVDTGDDELDEDEDRRDDDNDKDKDND